MRTVLFALGGALAVYLMNGEKGAQRRARLREQLERAKQMIRERVSGSPAQPKDYAPESGTAPAGMPERARS